MDLAPFLQKYGMILYILFFVVIFYFILIRPQRKKDKAYKELLASVEVGDEVTTIGGFYGKVTKVKDEKLVLEVGAEKNTLHVYKWAIKDVKKPEKA